MNIAKIVISIIFLLTLSADFAMAEYRVFNLIITKKGATPEEPPQTRTMTSTLDPLQYKYYYPVQPDETVSYTETWMCKGRTDHQNFCPNPRQESETSPTQ